jgi:hypothetical protein
MKTRWDGGPVKIEERVKAYVNYECVKCGTDVPCRVSIMWFEGY